MKKDISDLLAYKNIEDLTVAEQKLVLAEMTLQEYGEQRETIVAAQEIMANEAAVLKAPIAPLATLLALKKHKKRSATALFSHKIPTWAAVAACAILVTLFQASSIFDSAMPQDHETTIAAVDTIFIEKVITEFREVKTPFEQKSIEKNTLKTAEKLVNTQAPLQRIQSPTFSDQMLNAEQINYTALLQNLSASSGVSLQDDSLAQRVNQTVY